jgi:RNA polymerase sigma factor (sigma-70 family)
MNVFMIDKALIQQCRKMQREAQKAVYNLMAKKLHYTCKRYLKKEEDIEEVLADSFYLIFTKIDQLKEDAAFVSWARTITVNQCLLFLRKNINFNIYIDDLKYDGFNVTEEEYPIDENELLNLVEELPDGCRTIFNLFVIEEHSHKEISKLLNISEGTSKSQLNVAKTKLRQLVNNYYQKVK